METISEHRWVKSWVGDRLPLNAAIFVMAYGLWCVGDVADVVTAVSTTALRMSAIWMGWKQTLPWFAWGIGGVGILAGLAKGHSEGTEAYGRGLRLGGVFLLAVVLMRLLSLIHVISSFLPWLGLLWSPAATWSMGLFVAVWCNLGVRTRLKRAWSPRRCATGVFLLFAILYSGYAIYFVKTTPLHGDEPQYLLLTQSLLTDGDIDLANADRESKLAFHEFTFNVHRAPGSPEGRLHSSHPIGMPALLTVPYAIGDMLWGHPRLGAALFQAVLTAAACGLTVLFLSALGYSTAISVWTALLTGLSVPMFTQSNQLYPEIHAVLIAQAALIVFARWPEGGKHEVTVVQMVLICLGLVVLPFFHQRHLILAAILAVPVFNTIRRQGVGSLVARSGLSVLALGLLAHLLYNWHYSGDILGPFLPGNADTVGPELSRSLLGQWIDIRQGLLRQAPIYVLSIFGILAMIKSRDRRLVLLLGLFLSTAGVNNLSNDWSFGFCLPTRFMLTAHPALAIGLASGLAILLASRRPAALWMLLLGFWLGFESVLQGAVLPEGAFEGLNLVSRFSEPFYPMFAHFLDFVSGETLTSGVAFFWLMILAGLALALVDQWRRYSWALVALAPILVSHVLPFEALLGRSFAYQIARYKEDPDDWYYSRVDFTIPVQQGSRGVLTSSMPPLFRGKIDITPGIELLEDARDVIGFHTLQHVGFGIKQGGSRHTVPVINSLEQETHTFLTAGSAIGSQFVYSVREPVKARPTRWVLESVRASHETVFEGAPPETGAGNPVSMTMDGFKAGHYQVYVNREGAPWSDWVAREGGWNVVAIFTGFDRVKTDPEGLAKMARRWLEDGWRDVKDPLARRYFPPQVEARLPYFWSLLPEGLDQSSISFTLQEDGPIHIVIISDEVAVTGIRIDRVNY
jgi:hypothetical protein